MVCCMTVQRCGTFKPPGTPLFCFCQGFNKLYKQITWLQYNHSTIMCVYNYFNVNVAGNFLISVYFNFNWLFFSNLIFVTSLHRYLDRRQNTKALKHNILIL